MIKVIGHRGASENAPENTLSSISEAWSQSADGVEVDVRLTKDLKLVCIHDKNTLRTSGKDALVKNTTLEDLRKMDFGAWRGKEWINEPIPVLEEVLGGALGEEVVSFNFKKTRGRNTAGFFYFLIIKNNLFFFKFVNN